MSLYGILLRLILKISDLRQFPCGVRPKEGCEVHCPECNEWSSHKKWKYTKIDCDLCGFHPAMRCPVCKTVFDSVFCDMFEVR